MNDIRLIRRKVTRIRKLQPKKEVQSADCMLGNGFAKPSIECMKDIAVFVHGDGVGHRCPFVA
ncbi:hypothetical protein MTBSS4_550003 [Magnetospirillum sp. SS-4]|nr:hypothetical protein MTBSS4_550003 [Magnetospirillum sp. SS-4]